jgi:hypothetical protein
MKAHVILAMAGAACLTATQVFAAGDLATRATKLPQLDISIGESGYGMSQKSYELETGKAYKLKMKATGNKECKLVGPEFFSAIYVRQIEAGEAEILNPTFTGFSFDDPSEAEMYFVPVRTGKFTLYCEGLADHGMKVDITVK